MSEGLTVEYSGTYRRHRVRFERRDAGGWRRVRERHSDTHGWRVVGEEIVAELVVEDNADIVTPCGVAGDD
jgi:hypothetical protein